VLVTLAAVSGDTAKILTSIVFGIGLIPEPISKIPIGGNGSDFVPYRGASTKA
jgi:hypothetical protein